jgi:ferredoxin-NADP reductase
MTVPPVLLSVNVGLPKNVAWQGRTVYTGAWKHPVDGPAMVRRLNIDGDGQGDTNGHGGEQRAVLVYQIQSYQHWQRYFGRADFGYGQFGENLTVDGLTDDEVCIGDRYRLGEAEFEVTQPRVTCYRVGLRVGEPELPLDVAAPRGDFTLAAGTGPVLLISAGIGLTPVLAMLHELAATRVDHDVWWIHGARGPREHPLAAEAHALLARMPHGREHVFCSATAGRLSKDKLLALDLPAGASAYICGPASFMTDMQDALAAAGVDPARIHTELFGALPSINPGLTGQTSQPPHRPPGPAGTGPMVTFARSGISTRFGATRRSLLELADACDVPTRWSCRSGVCHTCTTPLLSGAVSYAPDPLESPADGEVLICCARPSADIVLDM